MRKICILAALVLALTVTMNGAAECLMPKEICGCWHGEDGGVLILRADRSVLYVSGCMVLKGSYALDGKMIYLDDLRPPAWEHGEAFTYALGDDLLILWDDDEALIYTKGGVCHGEN